VSPKNLARVAGLLYISELLLSGFSQMFVRPSVLMAGNATATADNIRATRPSFGPAS